MSRFKLHALLEITLGSNHVYYQPPENVKLNYPCIVYSRISGPTGFADDQPYLKQKKYKVTVIDKNPDSEIAERLSGLKGCSFDTAFTSNNLNHLVYNINY